jgi:hypothetical protein
MARDLWPDRLDDARALVSEHGRRRADPVLAERVQLGSADPDRGHAYEDVGLSGLVELDLPDLEGLVRPEEDGGP